MPRRRARQREHFDNTYKSAERYSNSNFVLTNYCLIMLIQAPLQRLDKHDIWRSYFWERGRSFSFALKVWDVNFAGVSLIKAIRRFCV